MSRIEIKTLPSIQDTILPSLTLSSQDPETVKNEISKMINDINSDTQLFIRETLEFANRLASKNLEKGLKKFEKKVEPIKAEIREKYLV
jgi:hypothetical protein